MFDVKLIAFYLPQFYPTPENDLWWGKGFTEWRNVTLARPRFTGHYQPHIPADLGFYDLRLPETRNEQAELAKKHGIYGFCYYHYWFNGKLLLDRPLNGVLSSKEPDLPFCICWANENWTRRWDGLEQQVLIKQDHHPEDDEHHIEWLINVFRDERYIRINKKPLLIIYRFDIIPHIRELIALWRKKVRAAGFDDLYLCGQSNAFGNLTHTEILKLGFDAVIEFQPHREYITNDTRITKKTIGNKIIKHWNSLTGREHQNFVRIDYKKYVELAMNEASDVNVIPCVFPSWDNSSRRKSHAVIIQNFDENEYLRWLTHSIKKVKLSQTDDKIVFINAMNEWGEGCHLEPDLRNGLKFLKATRKALAAGR
jgi:lipopolysaccharide biosynthesis protein